ncbi:hypothetical protein BSZ35_09065 [Salinibacter sp. 10B]|nr:hypothetical protein BSZ35_09065 [Salinibacter sp. 10B]
MCVALHYWTKIAELNDHAVLDTFIVMPNHVHGLLGLVPEPNVNDALEVGSLDSNEPTSKPNVATASTSKNRDLDGQTSRIHRTPGLYR